MREHIKTASMYLLLGLFWLFVLVPTYPFFGLLCVWISRRINGDGGPPYYLEFAKDWFTFRVIPFGDTD
jgi:hypothetical protein